MRALETIKLKFKDMEVTVTAPTKDGFKAKTWTELLAYKRAKAREKKK